MRLPIDRTGVVTLAALAWAIPAPAVWASTAVESDPPAVASERPAALEMNWTPVRMPTGERAALLGGSYMVALDADWGVGPAVYGAAQGAYGGLFTAGAVVQRRWRLGPQWHLAASLYAGAGGGVSSPAVNAGGGLMLRPEVSVRSEFGPWYLGVGIAQVRFPSGTIRDTQWALTLGRAHAFRSFAPDAVGRTARASDATGMGFDEIGLHAATETPHAASRGRAGQAQPSRLGKVGADLRRYIAPGSWWGVEAAGAAAGGYDGYMEIVGTVGQDWPVLSDRLRVGVQLGVGLAGGGDVDSGAGWMLRAGPSLRWITPWGPSLRAELALNRAPDGRHRSRQLRVGVSVPLEPVVQADGARSGFVHQQAWSLAIPRYQRFRFKDGSEAPVTGLGIAMLRASQGVWYGTAQAGSAAVGKAGAFSYGLVGVGVQTTPGTRRWRVGGELLAGAAGGGGVQVGGGAVAQGELWAQWEGRPAQGDRWRVRAGLGQWQVLRGTRYRSPMASLSLGWAFGTLGG